MVLSGPCIKRELCLPNCPLCAFEHFALVGRRPFVYEPFMDGGPEHIRLINDFMWRFEFINSFVCLCLLFLELVSGWTNECSPSCEGGGLAPWTL